MGQAGRGGAGWAPSALRTCWQPHAVTLWRHRPLVVKALGLLACHDTDEQLQGQRQCACAARPTCSAGCPGASAHRSPAPASPYSRPGQAGGGAHQTALWHRCARNSASLPEWRQGHTLATRCRSCSPSAGTLPTLLALELSCCIDGAHTCTARGPVRKRMSRTRVQAHIIRYHPCNCAILNLKRHAESGAAGQP